MDRCRRRRGAGTLTLAQAHAGRDRCIVTLTAFHDMTPHAFSMLRTTCSLVIIFIVALILWRCDEIIFITERTQKDWHRRNNCNR